MPQHANNIVHHQYLHDGGSDTKKDVPLGPLMYRSLCTALILLLVGWEGCGEIQGGVQHLSSCSK